MAPKVTVVLDWTPNGNHIGFFVAKDKGLYEALGLDVHIISPADPEYQGSYTPAQKENEDGGGSGAPKYVTPCSKVAEGSAQFAMNSPEGVVGWNVATGRPSLKAVAALLQDRNTSAIVALKSSGIASPKDLDGKHYASYAARFEGRIVQRMIQHAGGKGEYVEDTPPMLGIWKSVLEGKADATWVFNQWEGVEAKLKGVELNTFAVCDYGVPYAYAPCLCAHPDWLKANPTVAKAFLKATAEGYAIAAQDPAYAADALVRLTALTGHTIDPALALGSAEFLADKFLTTGTDGEGGSKPSWGKMDSAVWEGYVKWLWESDLLTTGMQSRHPDGTTTFSLDDLRAGKAGERLSLEAVPTVFTNAYLP